MKTTRSAVLACAALALVLAGCDKTTDHPKPVTATPATPGASGASGTSGSSVATPPSAKPPSDAAMKPDGKSASGSSGNAATPTQAQPAELSKSEEKSTMPHSGQVNNHSTPQTSGR